MRLLLTSSLLSLSLALTAGCATQTAPVAVADAPPPMAAPAPLSGEPAPLPSLVSEVDLPYTKFVLDNGLTVLVHEDHKAPVVATSVWYNVGSKDEPKGKTGFAHLFEHLMFYGSENLNEPTMSWLEKTGATDWNGTTWYDRTNYFETVPKSALEQTLFMESDRMGYLLGAVDQKRLDLQRGVVQNEKRQGDNQPGGLVDYVVGDELFPVGHPYRHSTIGSMADLDSASLGDVKQWFLDKYGPNNAVIALAGDITPDEAKVLVNKYFGAIPRGKVNNPAQADVPTLAAPKRIVMKDRVAATEIRRYWIVPGLLDNQLASLEVGTSVLGGLASSRLKDTLVRGEKIAVAASAQVQPFHRISYLEIDVTVKPGVDVATVEGRLDQLVADFLANGPTEDEIRRAATQSVAGEIRGMESTGGFGGQAGALAEGQLYAGDPTYYRKRLENLANVTPAQVKATMQQWLGRPPLTIVLEQGEREPYVEAKGGKASKAPDIKVASVKREMPPRGPAPSLDFPDVAHAKLANGIPVAYAQRSAQPLTQLALSFDAGYAADPVGKRGLQNMVTSVIDEGAAGRTAQQILEEKERLGASISIGGSADRSTLTLSALSANLAPSLALARDILVDPTFAPAEIDRVKTQMVTAIAQAKTDPQAIAQRALMPQLFGDSHPYGATALGDEASVKALSRDDLVAFKDAWLRPDKAKLFVVSDSPLAEILPQLEAAFGQWQAPAAAAGVKDWSMAAPPAGSSRIVLIDRPSSPQSVIFAGQLTPIDPRGDIVPVTAGTDVFGGMTSSRINLDLREDKSWSYGAFGGMSIRERATPYLIQAGVQADRTGDSVAEIRKLLTDLGGSKGVTEKELALAVANNVDGLPGQFETGAAVLGAMMANDMYGRPDNYYELIGPKFRALDQAAADAAFRQAIQPDKFVYVVVGDAAKVRPQLDKLGLPIEVMQPR